MNNFSKNLLSFKGHTIIENGDNKKQYKFFLPTEAENVQLEVQETDKKTKESKVYTLNVLEPKKSMKIWNYDINPEKNYKYRFKFPSKNQGEQYYLDNTIGADGWNIPVEGKKGALHQPRLLYHVMPDNFNPDVTKDKNGNPIFRNHFNKYNGNLNNIISKLDDIKKLGVNRIISTPIFGQDQISSHGYWTTNPYQITSTLGSINDFRKLQTELYKRNMGWVADGAFVNEGLEGVHIKDILKWGEQSPFKNWFELANFPLNQLALGVLPKEESGYNHFDIKLINSPFVWDVDVNGIPKNNHGKKNPKYDAKKPIKIQLFDRRLASDEQIKSEELIRSYANKQTTDTDEIKTYKDSVQPLSFEVSYSELERKFNEAKKDGFNEPFKNYLLSWNSFNLTNSDKSGGATLWDGNKDIPKLRFTTPQKKLNAALNPEEILKANAQVQDYITQVGAYWTAETAKTLTEYTAEKLGKEAGSLDSELDNSQKAAKLYEAMKKLATGENPQIPLSAIKLINEQAIKKMLDTAYSPEDKAYKGGYSLNTSKLPENITEALMEFPLDSIELPAEYTSVLSSPFIKKLATTFDDIGVSRYDLLKDTAYNEKTNATYRKMDELYKKDLTKLVKDVVDTNKELKAKIYDAEGNLTSQGKEILKLVSSDVMKYVVIKAISDAKPSSESLESGTALDYNSDEIAKGAFRNSPLRGANPEYVALNLISSIKDNLDLINKNELGNYLAKRVKNLNNDNIKIAKLILDKTESGLDWRIDASKDIADSDAKYFEDSNMDEYKNHIIGFWSKFNTAVNAENAKSYKIAEITSMGSNEKEIVQKSGFTTSTNYSQLFSSPQRWVHGFSEDNGKDHENNLSLDLGNAFNDLIYSGDITSVLYSHVAPGNHDKPRALHTFSMNIGKFFKECPQNAMAEAMNDSFDKTFTDEVFDKLGIDKSLRKDLSSAFTVASMKLQNGDVKESSKNYYGIKSFDQNWFDMIQIIKAYNPELIEKLTDKQLEKLKNQVQNGFLAPALKKYRHLFAMLTTLPGNPTVYAGDELGMTGFDKPGKNVSVKNRENLKWDNLEAKDAFGNDYINWHRDALAEILNLRSKPELSPLVDGMPVPLKKIKGKDKDNDSLFAFYRYNTDRDVITVLNNAGLTNDRTKSDVDKQTISEIDLDLENNLGLPWSLEKKCEYGAYSIGNDGKPVSDGQTYILKDGTRLINNIDGQPIVIDGPAKIFYRKENFNK